MNAASLLELVRGLLERTFLIESGLTELAPFIIGDLGYRALYAHRREQRSIGEGVGEARTLVRESGDTLHVRVYFPDAMIRRLEQHPPQRGVGEANVDAFATFIEEIDHLLLLAERARQERPVSLFELELHANVSKELVLARFLAGSAGRLHPQAQVWLRARLFGVAPGGGEEPAVRARYRDATRYALRLLDALARHRPSERLETLRRFHAAGCRRKLELIARL